MSTTSRLLTALFDALRPRKTAPQSLTRAEAVEVDPNGVGPVRMSYSPDLDGDADPGEIVWTWVPYQEHDGRGEDSEGHRNWANIDRVFRLTSTGIRREAIALDAPRYRRVEAAIRRQYGWS